MYSKYETTFELAYASFMIEKYLHFEQKTCSLLSKQVFIISLVYPEGSIAIEATPYYYLSGDFYLDPNRLQKRKVSGQMYPAKRTIKK